MTCPTPCDDDCEVDCHEGHYVAWKQQHDWRNCPGVPDAVAAG